MECILLSACCVWSSQHCTHHESYQKACWSLEDVSFRFAVHSSVCTILLVRLAGFCASHYVYDFSLSFQPQTNNVRQKKIEEEEHGEDSRRGATAATRILLTTLS